MPPQAAGNWFSGPYGEVDSLAAGAGMKIFGLTVAIQVSGEHAAVVVKGAAVSGDSDRGDRTGRWRNAISGAVACAGLVRGFDVRSGLTLRRHRSHHVERFA